MQTKKTLNQPAQVVQADYGPLFSDIPFIYVILGPVHMHIFTYVSKVTYVSKFTYGACERTYLREYKYSWSKLG